MAVNWGGGASGAVQGGVTGSQAGPYGAAAGAIIGGLLGLFSKKKKDGESSGGFDTGDILNLATSAFGSKGGASGSGGNTANLISSFISKGGSGGSEQSGSDGIGGYADIARKALSIFGGGGESSGAQPMEDPTQDKVVQTTPSIPANAQLLGFPSFGAINVRNQLQNALARSRGF